MLLEVGAACWSATQRRGHWWAAVTVLLVLAADADAESPWVLQAGAGIGVHRTRAEYPEAPRARLSFGPGMQLDAGYRVHRIAAVGLHLGTQVIEAPNQIAPDSFEQRTYVGIEAGVSGSLVFDRVTLTPWLGLQSLHSKRYRAGGLSAAFDVRRSGHESIAGFASIIANRGWPIRDAGVLVGVAYRSW